MSEFDFKPAVRTTSKIKMAILGPSGSGKTYSALQIASGFGERIALIDTEAGSASLYSDKFQFATMILRPPFTAERYIKAIHSAVKAGFGLLIIDSLTHAWDGEGGAQDQKHKLDSRGGRQNEFVNWGPVKSEHKKLLEAINQCPVHVISTLRAKQDYQIVSSGGKTKPEKVGLGPIAMPGTEYEYALLLELAMNHEAFAAKDRTGLFDNRFFLPTPEIGQEIKNWLSSATMPEIDFPDVKEFLEQSKSEIPDIFAIKIDEVSLESLLSILKFFGENRHLITSDEMRVQLNLFRERKNQLIKEAENGTTT